MSGEKEDMTSTLFALTQNEAGSCVWEVDNGEITMLGEIPKLTVDMVRALELNSFTNRLISVSNSSLQLWSLKPFELMFEAPVCLTSPEPVVHFDPDGSKFVFINDTITLYDCATGSALEFPTIAVEAAAWRYDGVEIAAMVSEGVAIVDSTTGEAVFTFDIIECQRGAKRSTRSSLFSLITSPVDGLCAVAGNTHVCVVDLLSRERCWTTAGMDVEGTYEWRTREDRLVLTFGMLSGVSVLLTCSGVKVVVVEARTGIKLHSFTISNAYPCWFNFASENVIGMSVDCKCIEVLNVSTGETLQVIARFDHNIGCVGIVDTSLSRVVLL